MPIENSVIIETLSHEGRGVAHVKGKTVFVQGGLPGETVHFEYVKRHRQYDEAKAIEIISAHPDRVSPACAHFNVCGGCRLQHYHPAKQIAHKQQIFLEQLQHIANVQPDAILPPLTAESFGYRRKARLGVKYVAAKGRVLIGFREHNGRFLADISTCSVLHPTVGNKLTALSELIAGLSIYQKIPQIEVAVADTVTALIIRHLQAFTPQDLQKLRDFAQIHAFHLYLQPGNSSTCQLFWPENGDPYLSYSIEGLTLLFQPQDFTQVNFGINTQMVRRTIELLQPKPHEKLLDLFCGLGNFTLPFATHCQHITGVEGSQEMVQRAQMNAHYNHITNVEFYSSDLDTPPIAQLWANRTYDKIILDPPRSGALAVVQTIQRFGAHQILYISCNPATLARDTAELLKQGYRLQQAGIMDMFPHTSHVEAMALFTNVFEK
jgi:23S rRNA (uracil1939-C5)-methyltransferase